jgi:lipid-A-disaccharide synthase
MVRTSMPRGEFLTRHELAADQPLLVLLPGSRAGEARRHLPGLLDAVQIIKKSLPASVILATPQGFAARGVFESFQERIAGLSIKIIENETWNSIGHADLALAASGTVTMEAAVLGTPMVTFYKVNPLSWWAGRRLVKVPFLSMVNLVAGRQIVPELIQHEMTGPKLAAAALELLGSQEKAARMRLDLAAVRSALTGAGDPLTKAAQMIAADLESKWGVPAEKPEALRETID